MNSPSNKITFNKEKQLKGAKNHFYRIVFLEIFILLIAFWKGLFTSGNNIQTIIVVIISLLSISHLVYIINKYYKKTINSIEFIDSEYYLITCSLWFSRIYNIQVRSEKIKISIDKIDPNSGTSAFSVITFYDQNKAFKFEISLEDLKNILIFCWRNKPYNLTMSEKWDVKEISNYKGFEELKTIL